MGTIRVFLLDDSVTFLESLEAYLALHAEIMVVGRAQSGLEALEQVPLLRPDVVLVDLEMPEMNGLVVTLKLKALPNPPRVVMLTFHYERPYRELAEAVQVDRFVSKKNVPLELVPILLDLQGQKKKAAS